MESDAWLLTHPENAALLEDAYSIYLKDPEGVSPPLRKAFSSLKDQPQSRATVSAEEATEIAALRIDRLIQAYRAYGHLCANINPIAIVPIEEPQQLNLEFLGFSSQELTHLFPTRGLLAQEYAPLTDIIAALKETYCRTIGVEYLDRQGPDFERWLEKKIEPSHFQPALTIDQKKMILQQLNKSELLEIFIHTKYTGQKRFSVEGGETLIPMLEAAIETGSSLGIEEFVIGMAHRGRLNVLSNILKKSYADIFTEFDESYIPNSFEGSGDVKYHKGFFAEVSLPNGKKVTITVAPNPSHLESVNPVVEGMVRAQQRVKHQNRLDNVLPIIIHGDAAISGQGVVYETMQFYKVPGYATGGTLHIVINNQIGFTATPEESRSTRYCTDIAKTFDAPVFHVNAEDPEACVYVTNLALEIRQKLQCDVFIDLNCYRKYGHNESDEPAFTQPLEYQIIRKKRSIRELYRDQLIHEGIVEQHIAEGLEKEFTQSLHDALAASKESLQNGKIPNKKEKGSKPTAQPITTAVSKKTLLEVAQKMSAIPEGFTIHPKIQHLVQERLKMAAGEKPIDWGMGEMLAYGTLLWEGKDVRLAGEDCQRGTFSHRHAAWMDQQKEHTYASLSHLRKDQGRFDVINSPLSENAALGFEYGYSVAHLDALVIWEGQFGDFFNGAQVVVDEYLAAAEQKWGQVSNLVMLLPHGYEGQGPDHSSGRMERFLEQAGDLNMRIVDPTTPAQLFHLLRKQVLNPIRKPLIIFSPKGLLRHPLCISTVQDFTEGRFQEVIDDPSPGQAVKRLIFCTGRIYYDLISERSKTKTEDMAIVRIEQLYPFETEQVAAIIKKYSQAHEFIWVQEEPANMGAAQFMRPLLQALLPKGKELRYVGRAQSAAPATGSHAQHKKEHAALLKALF